MTESYKDFYRRSIDDKEAFWAEEAEKLYWHRKWDRVCDFDNPPFVRWFVGGETNTCYNAVDRHLSERGDQRAIIWISSEVGQTRELTYRELYEQVNRYAAVLQDFGVGKGDRIIVYLPMIP